LNGKDIMVHVGVTMYLAASEWVGVKVFQDSGSSKTLLNHDFWKYFSGHFVCQST